MIETKIYIGLNHKETKRQEFDSEKYVSILRYVCFSYHLPFSFCFQEGGYFHENGDFVEEKTIVLSIIDMPADTINEMARDLCAFFNQESVLVTQGEVKRYFVSDKVS